MKAGPTQTQRKQILPDAVREQQGGRTRGAGGGEGRVAGDGGRRQSGSRDLAAQTETDHCLPSSLSTQSPGHSFLPPLL